MELGEMLWSIQIVVKLVGPVQSDLKENNKDILHMDLIVQE